MGQIGRVVGREVAEDALGRLIAGQTADDLFAREEIARRIGQKSFDLLADKIKKEVRRGEDERIEKDDRKKEIDWNARMNDFARNLNENYRQNTTRYKEVRNLGNKEKIEDRFGLSNAYASKSGLYSTGKTLYISGTTGKDGSMTRDIIDDLIHLPTRNAEKTEKYKDVMKYLNDNPHISRLVSHSLGSAVVNTINQNFPDKYQTTTYATPAVKPKRKGKQDPKHRDFRNPNDVVSMLDGYAITSDYNEPNVITAHGFKNFAGNGMFHIRPSTRISNGINPNSPVQQ